MQKLIKLDNETRIPSIVEDSAWSLVESDSDLASLGDKILVPVEQFLAAPETYLNAGKQLGLALDNTTEPETIQTVLPNVDLITIPFPLFTDGRGYSLARMLRQDCQYTKEIRAVGDVLHDQLFFMARCGFDAFALREGVDIDHALTAFKSFSVTYQPAMDEPKPLFAR